jgi:hypothetical protein
MGIFLVPSPHYHDRKHYSFQASQRTMKTFKIVATFLFLSSQSSAFQVAQKRLPFRLTSPTKLCATEKEFQDKVTSNNRRVVLSLPVGVGLACMGLQAPKAFAASPSTVDYKAVASDIENLVKSDPDKGPTLVRLAWHSSGTYDKMKKDGGSGPGTIRFKEELLHGGNAGLGETAVQWLEPIHTKYADSGLSYADLYTLAGGKKLQMINYCFIH